MDGEIDTTTKSRWLTLYVILDVNTQVGECPSMVCRNSKLHSHELVTSYLQDFNIFWLRYSPDHKHYPYWSHHRCKVMLYGINNGSESYSGMKIPWPERAVSVRIRPEAPETTNHRLVSGINMNRSRVISTLCKCVIRNGLLISILINCLFL